MGLRLSHQDFKLDVLSTEAVALVSEFALILYRRYGILIDVDSSDVVLRVFQYATRCEDRRLKTIFLHIKTEFCISMISSNAVHRSSYFRSQGNVL